MKWTKDKPTLPGWYFIHGGDFASTMLVSIRVTYGQFALQPLVEAMAAGIGKDDPWCGEPNWSDIENNPWWDDGDTNTWFCGPLVPPPVE